jgi:hypothetical protein
MSYLYNISTCSLFMSVSLLLQFSIEVGALKVSLLGMQESEQAILSAGGRRHLAECQDSIRTIEDITSFMLANIHRCLDYTKASAGVLLAASNSTFHLQEALLWAVKCIRRSKESSIAIDLKHLSEDICEHIISDQQVEFV